jgi:Protein of unknown function (DUF2442)
MSPRVTKTEPLPDYELLVTFDNGEKRKFSLLPYLQYPAFSLLRNIEFFKTARVAHGTVIWTDEIDISPDTLYLCGKPDQTHCSASKLA